MRLRSCASATIMRTRARLRLPVCARSGCGGRGGGQSQTEQSSRPTGKQKKHKESAQLRFPCALRQTVFGRYSMPFQYSTSEPERQIHNAAVADLAAVHAAGAEELHQHGLHPLGLFDLPQSIRQGDLHSDPPLSFGAGVVLTPPGCFLLRGHTQGAKFISLHGLVLSLSWCSACAARQRPAR